MALMTHCLSKYGNASKLSTGRKVWSPQRLLFSAGKRVIQATSDFRRKELRHLARKAAWLWPWPQQLGRRKPLLWSRWRGAAQEKEARERRERPPPEGLRGPRPALSSPGPSPPLHNQPGYGNTESSLSWFTPCERQDKPGSIFAVVCAGKNP